MASKTVNLSLPAYAAAQAAKRPGESFSDLMLRTFQPTSLLDLVGILSEDQAQAIQQSITDGRTRSAARREQQLARWPESA